MSTKAVTEADFRRPQFRDAKIEDYEFDGSGELARKDRFRTFTFHVAGSLDFSFRGEGFKIEDVKEKFDSLIETVNGIAETLGVDMSDDQFSYYDLSKAAQDLLELKDNLEVQLIEFRREKVLRLEQEAKTTKKPLRRLQSAG